MSARQYSAVIFLSILLIFFIAPIKATTPELEWISGYAIDGVDNLEPSGLTYCNERWLFVSDKHSRVVFELAIQKDSPAVNTKVYKTLADVPEPPSSDFPFLMQVQRFFAELFGITGGFDWEGISCDQEGNIYLASEYYFSVLKVAQDGTYQWIAKNLYQQGVEKGLFAYNNAYLEGITITDDSLLVVAERQPRAFIQIDSESDSQITVDSKGIKTEQGVNVDFTGLYFRDKKLYTLERNEYQICERKWPELTKERCFSFEKISRSIEWGYDKDIYGLAEGVAMNENQLAIIIDNNGDSRLSNAKDNRPALWLFKNPFTQ
ncbi:esterase-like activity of phytase family protein [Pleionea sp. CnH1-48]|uniref:esterase-like activity of phytase family protein n=1 Tax=Pleionea sp. CnH1-48 TaxID=2954494 RepID=UPI0020975EEC|nr:esterase-like activity of phytase family protein [Pleionea sp. CnH1-48]